MVLLTIQKENYIMWEISTVGECLYFSQTFDCHKSLFWGDAKISWTPARVDRPREGELASWVTCDIRYSSIQVSVQLYSSLVMCPWAGFFISISLKLPICKMDRMLVFILEG